MSLLPSCRDVSKLLSEARDSGRPLGFHVRIHLSICDVCRRVLAQFTLLGEIVKKAPASGPALSDDAKERLRRALNDAK
ncbi:MAG: zf-HC2 domain-containing protein [Elusimicrobiota bacterium]